MKPINRNLLRALYAVVLMGLVQFGYIDAATAAMSGMLLTFETVAGSTLAVSVAAPATYDATGYGALTYTVVGELTDLGTGLGRQYNTVTHSPIATSQVIEKKASYKLGSIDMMCAWDMSDAGQDLLRTAADSQTQILSIKITKQSGDIRYFTAQVAKFVENFGTVDTVNAGSFTLLRQKDVVNNPA